MKNPYNKIKFYLKKLWNKIEYEMLIRKKVRTLQRTQKFLTAIEIHKHSEHRIREYRKRLGFYISDLENDAEPFLTWEDLNYCLINPLRNVGEHKPETFGYLNAGYFGIIGYVESYQECKKTEVKGIPVIEHPIYASFLHINMASTLLEKKFKETQIENLKRKNQINNAFKSNIAPHKAIEVLERESKRILSIKKDDCVFFGSVKNEFKPNDIYLIKKEKTYIPHLKESKEELLKDIRYFPDGNYEVWDADMNIACIITLKNGREINT